MDVRELLRRAADQLHAAGVGSPRTDAELLLAHRLGVTRARLLGVTLVGAADAAAFDALVQRRAAREPLQYLTGHAPFRYLELAVGPGVFIPRPETELLVDAVLPALRELEAPVVVDLCSGSGALALSIAHECPGARVIAVECSPDALHWLRINAAGTDVRIVAADIADPAALAELHELAGTVDAVLSNPPYVPTAVEVGPEVRHDPELAVFAGPDGLGLMPSVLAVAADLLRPGGAVAIEHDDTHGEAVPKLLHAAARWVEIGDHADLSGRPRFATAVRAH